MMNKITILSLFLLALTNGFSQTIHWSEDFSSTNLSNWTLVDADADTNEWENVDVSGNWVASSASWLNTGGSGTALTPDNWMISSAIDLTALTTGTVVLATWKARARHNDYPAEKYTVYIDTLNTIADFTTSTTSFTETLTSSGGLFVSKNLDMSSYAGKTIYIAFRHHDCTDQVNIYLDDIEIISPPAIEIELQSTGLDESFIGTNAKTITGTIVNKGSSAISSFDVSWTNGTLTENHTFSGVNIPYGGTYNFSHPTTITVNEGTVEKIDITVSLTGDVDASNNAGDTKLTSLLFGTDKVVVGEEATGTWCGWCPRGHVYLEQLKNDYPDTWIGIAVHNADPMTNSSYDTEFSPYISGYPSGAVDRTTYDTDPSDFEDVYNINKNNTSPADIDLSVTNNGGVLDIKVEAQFAVAYNEHDYRFSVVIIENNVTGTASNYGQVNYYSGGSSALNGAGHNWQTAASTVPAASMIYQDVARDFVGGFNGLEGSLPETIEVCTKYTHDFTYTVPAGYDVANIEVVALLIENPSHAIVNAKLAHIGGSTMLDSDDPQVCKTDNIKDVDNKILNFKVFPNPATDYISVNIETEKKSIVNVELLNILGKTIEMKEVKDNNVSFNTSNLSSGIYMINVISEGRSITSTSIAVK